MISEGLKRLPRISDNELCLGKGDVYEKKSIQNSVAGVCVCFPGCGSGRGNPSRASYHAVSSARFFLLCKGIEKISQMVYGDETLSESSGQFCERTRNDLEDQIMYSVSGIGDADLRCRSDAEYPGTDFDCGFVRLQICVFFHKN